MTNFDQSLLDENSFERCQDHSDNDSDGLIDCDDLNCGLFSFCSELTADACTDGKDNDGDNLVDCQDPGCLLGLKDVCEGKEETISDCSDGDDNDGDGLVDCQDAGCRKLLMCQEISVVACKDGQDNDQDGLVDCNDFDCYLQEHCCVKEAAPAFTGDDFSSSSTCAIVKCTPRLTGCCEGDYTACCGREQVCNPFTISRWIVWGFPRPRQEGGAFFANEPCDCESSGIVSLHQMNLETSPTQAKGLELRFNLMVSKDPPLEDLICAGLTLNKVYIDKESQCASGVPPPLLAGICLQARTENSGAKDAGGPDTATKDAAVPDMAAKDAGPADATPDKTSHQATIRAKIVLDGVVVAQQILPSPGPIKGVITLTNTRKLQFQAGPLSHTSQSPLDVSIKEALALIYGHGTTARLDSLEIEEPSASRLRCKDPTSWIRHINRGKALFENQDLSRSSRPTVTLMPKNTYMMFFAGKSPYSQGIYMAQSADGIQWSLHSDPVVQRVVPVIKEGDAKFGDGLSSPSVVLNQKRYHLWYTRRVLLKGLSREVIAQAFSDDGIKWTPVPGPGGADYVLGPGQTWDSYSVTGPSVLEDPDGKGWLMWYTGNRKLQTGVTMSAIGLATSSDGKVWTNGAKAIISPSPGSEDMTFEEPHVLFHKASGLYMIWYTYHVFGKFPSIRHAVSPKANRDAWVHAPANPVIQSGALGSFDERGVLHPTVIHQDGVFHLWFTGYNSGQVPGIGYARNRGDQ